MRLHSFCNKLGTPTMQDFPRRKRLNQINTLAHHPKKLKTNTPNVSNDKQQTPYTQEQIHIVNLALPPQAAPHSQIVRVTSGAGTGKTTTLAAVAKQLLALGHHKIIFLTFNKAAAEDAKKRLPETVLCQTINAAALHCLTDHLNQPIGIMEENDLNPIIAEKFHADIHRVLAGVTNKKKKRRFTKKMEFFIKKNLLQFLHSSDSIRDGFDHTLFNKTYFPVEDWHRKEMIPRPKDFYTKHAKALFEELRPMANKLHDLIVKEVQLLQCPLDCTAVLVDESQDCNRCQVSWLAKQQKDRQVFFVGDAAQTIYGFRGSKSESLFEIPYCIDAKLTRCFRFGPQICAVANTILFAKEYSPQDKWKPYRLVGCSSNSGCVLFQLNDITCKRTILAWKNVTLLTKALEIFGQNKDIRFSINGKGANSGANKWRKIVKEIDICFNLFKGDNRQVKNLPAFENEDLSNFTFEDFEQAIVDRQLNDYVSHLSIIRKFRDDTPVVVEKFRTLVLDQKYSPIEADIILSTVHAAKGMEWNNVEVLDDMIDLANFQTLQMVHPLTGEVSANAQFAFKNYGDDVNLLYVAITRARETLILPASINSLLQSFDKILYFNQNKKDHDGASIVSLPPVGAAVKKYRLDQVYVLHDKLVKPWLEEMRSQVPEKNYLFDELQFLQ